MKKICEVLIRTGENKFIPIGTAKTNLEFELGDKEYYLNKVTLEEIKLSIKNGDTIWEKTPELWN